MTDNTDPTKDQFYHTDEADTMTILEEREHERAVDRIIVAVVKKAANLSTEEIEDWIKEVEG